jgi:predicted ribosomally synthesized peptide with nif11-like leader
MSKNKVFEFFSQAAKNESLKEKVQAVDNETELIDLGKKEGFEFSSEHLKEAVAEMSQKPNFFRKLAESFLDIFSPDRDNYPAVGVQPYDGEPNRERY